MVCLSYLELAILVAAFPAGFLLGFVIIYLDERSKRPAP